MKEQYILSPSQTPIQHDDQNIIGYLAVRTNCPLNINNDDNLNNIANCYFELYKRYNFITLRGEKRIDIPKHIENSLIHERIKEYVKEMSKSCSGKILVKHMSLIPLREMPDLESMEKDLNTAGLTLALVEEALETISKYKMKVTEFPIP